MQVIFKTKEELDAMKKEYFVQHVHPDGEVVLDVMNAYSIIGAVSMSDCSGEELYVWESTEEGKVTRLAVFGCWHDPDDPLYIKAVRPDGTVVFDGYGVEH